MRSAAIVVLILGVLHIGSAALRFLLERSADISGTSAEPGKLAGLVVDCLIGGVMLACFVWARRAPLPALGAAFLVWASVHAIAGFVSPVTLLTGLGLKIVGLGLLVRGVLAARKASSELRRLARTAS